MIYDGQVEPSMPTADQARVDHTRLRRRMLYGQWGPDLAARILLELQSTERTSAWGIPDITGNLFAPGCKAISTLYAPDAPRPAGPSTSHELVLDAVKQGGLWELMIRGQRDTIGMREWLVRVDPLQDTSAPLGWGLSFRPAFADRVAASPRRSAPDQPAAIRELVYCTRPGDDRDRWWWECWAIEGEGAPYHRWETDSGIVVAQDAAYPYYDADGRAVLPYSLYHAERTGYLWDPWEWIEVVEGSLTLGVMWTYFKHCVKNASFIRPYMAGLHTAAEAVPQSNGEGSPIASGKSRIRVVHDPAFVLQLFPDPDSTVQPLIGAFPMPTDPDKVCTSIGDYERRVTGFMGIDPASVRRDSGDPRSGYAITVTRDAQIEQQQRFRPQFMRGDLETLRVAAAVLGSAAGASLPGTEFEIEYGPEVAEDVEPAAGAGPAEGAAAVQDTALNGAQIASLVDLVERVAAGTFPRDAAIAIAQRSFQVDAAGAEAMLGSAGKGFVPKPTGGSDGAGRQAGAGAPGAAGDGDDEADGGGDGGGGAA